jgi:enoyl-CoA hydratase
VFTGRRLDALEAHTFGFVNAVVPLEALERETLDLAARILANSPTAVSYAKRALIHGPRVSLDQGLVIEAETWLANLASPNRVEGLTAFLEKRSPNFVDE